MKVTFIHHSSFLVESRSAMLLFDYYQGELPPLDGAKPLYILTSHKHADHYGKIIYSIADTHPDVRYILSGDVPQRDLPAGFKCPVTYIDPHQEYQDELLKVRTLMSNDRGVAFVCEVDGKKIYHGGDLNNWCWDKGETALEDERIYHKELGRIKKDVFDVAFIPMDTRLKDYRLGIDDFMQYSDAKTIFPMHLWDKFNMIREYLSLDTCAAYRDRIRVIERDGQEFDNDA